MNLIRPIGETQRADSRPVRRQSEIARDATTAMRLHGVVNAICGACTLIIAISLRAALLPARSIISAAFRQSRRVISMSMRARAIRSSQTE